MTESFLRKLEFAGRPARIPSQQHDVCESDVLRHVNSISKLKKRFHIAMV